MEFSIRLKHRFGIFETLAGIGTGILIALKNMTRILMHFETVAGVAGLLVDVLMHWLESFES